MYQVTNNLLKNNSVVNNKKQANKFQGLSYNQWLKRLGIAYLGGVCNSAKEMKSLKNGCLTYMLYLAPSNLSGYQTCPNDKYCKDLCLNGSGHNKIEKLANNNEGLSKIDKGRIKRTKLFYENRELFMFLLCHEIEKYCAKANLNNLSFAVRLNGTSDLSPLLFQINGINILDYYHNIQFYDYTKVKNRFNIKKSNYDLTFSFNGHNWEDCEEVLNNNGKIAVVFDGLLPKKFHGYKVNNANNYDMRFLDNPKEICGLSYHRVANNYDKQGNYIGFGDTEFIVKETDKYSEF